MDVLKLLDESVRMQERYMPTPTGGTNERPEHFFQRMYELKQARSAVAELIEAAERSLNWLASYPGGGAIGAYKQMRDALSAVRPSQGDGGGKGEGEKVG